MDKPPLPIFSGANTPIERFQTISSRLNELSLEGLSVDRPAVEIVVESDRISLRGAEMDERALISISFTDGAANHRRLYGGGRSQQLSKALGLDQKKNLSIVDATAGLASDSFVMASLGAEVQMLERSPILSLMIDDALEMASFSEDEILTEIISKMSIKNIQSIDWLSQQVDQSCEVIYLDPMFPKRRKKAAVKKEMQILQRLLNEGAQVESERLIEEGELLKIALDKVKFRVVVKRPRSAPVLIGPSPTYSLSGKSIRFDIYTRKKIS